MMPRLSAILARLIKRAVSSQEFELFASPPECGPTEFCLRLVVRRLVKPKKEKSIFQGHDSGIGFVDRNIGVFVGACGEPNKPKQPRQHLVWLAHDIIKEYDLDVVEETSPPTKN